MSLCGVREAVSDLQHTGAQRYQFVRDRVNNTEATRGYMLHLARNLLLRQM